MLLLERPKASYCNGRYSREHLLSHCNPAGFSFRKIFRNYLGRRARGQEPPLPAGKSKPLPTREQRHAHFRRLRDTITCQGYDSLRCPGWGGREFSNNLHDYGVLSDGAGAYANTAADWKQRSNYVHHLHSWMGYYSTAQDRAVRWAGSDGLSLAEASATFYPNHHPDYSAEHHGTTSWGYILGGPATSTGGGKPHTILFAAAVCGRKPEDLIPPLRARDYPDLARFAGYTRYFLRSLTAPEGSAMYPMASEGYERRITNSGALSWFFAYDATVNQNPESAAYLSRSIQKTMRCVKAPRPASRCSGPYYRTALSSAVTAYYLVKHWPLPEELPSWEQVQATNGGTTFFRYQDWYVHRNPHKVLTVRTGVDPVSDACGDRQIHATYHPTPYKAGHGIDFLQPFRAFRYHRWDAATLENRDRGGPIFGDYGRAGRPVVAQSWGKPSRYGRQRCRPSDGGISIAMVQTHPRDKTVIQRALFSLDGRLTAILEQSPKPGRLAPMNFLVKNFEGYSLREGPVPKVRWKIVTAGRTVAFADVQDAPDGSEATIAESARWYDIDDLHAVALPAALPLRLTPVQFKGVRDTLYFGPAAGGVAVIYSGVAAGDMPRLAEAVRLIEGLPEGVKGLQAFAPEGYRVFALANFRDGKPAEWRYTGRTPEGAPVFAVPTQIRPDGQARATIRFDEGPDAHIEEPRFYVSALTGASIRAVGQHHRLELTALGDPATATVRFFSATREGKIRIEGPPGLVGPVEAAALRDKGIRIELKADTPVHLAVADAADRDRLGPYVDITAPRWKRHTKMKGIYHGHFGLWEPIEGKFTFKADAADRSGVSKVEFYLNNGQLIGTDTEAPYECEHEVKDTFCQYVYAVAYDKLGNHRKSFVVPFGDGTVGPTLLKEEQE
jgi:hypothetical protein